MADQADIPIIQCSYQLTLEICRFSTKLPRSVKFIVAEPLTQQSQNFLSLIVQTNAEPSQSQRLSLIDNSLLELRSIRLKIRLLKDMRTLSAKQHAVLNARIEDIQRQLQGWRRWTSSSSFKT